MLHLELLLIIAKKNTLQIQQFVNSVHYKGVCIIILNKEKSNNWIPVSFHWIFEEVRVFRQPNVMHLICLLGRMCTEYAATQALGMPSINPLYLYV